MKVSSRLTSRSEVKRARASGRRQNFQQADGSVIDPDALRLFMDGVGVLKA